MTIQIIRANENDSEVIARILIASWRFAYKDIMPDDLLDNLSTDQRRRVWTKHLNSGGEAYLLHDNLDVCGVIEISAFRDGIEDYAAYGEIPVIYLTPDRIGRGLGSAMMTFALDVFRARRVSGVGIWVLEKNKRAVDFYRKHGFSFSGQTKKHGPTGLVEWLMIRAEQGSGYCRT